MKLKLLTIGHSYVVGLNRRLAHEIARAGKDRWQVTVIAPCYFHGGKDLRPVYFEQRSEDQCDVAAYKTYLSQFIHLFFYDFNLQQLLKSNWSVIHVWEEPYILAGAQIALYKSKESKLIYRTAQSLNKKYLPPFNSFEKYSMNKASGWICSGQTVYKNLKNRNAYHKPVQIIPLGVDTFIFRKDEQVRTNILAKLGWAESTVPVIGFVGRFVPDKGIGLLMKVLDKVSTPWRILFIGTGPMEAEMKQWAKQHSDNARIITTATHDDMPMYYNAMDILCAPSQTTPHWREQFGRMLIEAFACRVPVIGSDSGEIPYVVSDAGIIVPEKDEDAWVTALSDLLDNPQKRERLGKIGRERAETLYSWPIIARQHLSFFEQILSQREE